MSSSTIATSRPASIPAALNAAIRRNTRELNLCQSEQIRSSAYLETIGDDSAPLAAEPCGRSRRLKRGCTTTPAELPPQTHFPECAEALIFDHSQTGGVKKRWLKCRDDAHRPACGLFQYRRRRRSLSAAEEIVDLW
jgi:hypothetical protein